MTEGSPPPGGPGRLLRIIESALARGALDPLVLDIRELASFTDAFVLLSGRSERQVRAIAEAIVDSLREIGDVPLGVEGLEEGSWVLIDCNDVIVHVFEPERRDLYSLERLWSDAPQIDLPGLGVPEAELAAASSGELEMSRRTENFL